MSDVDTAAIRGAYSVDDHWHLPRARVLAMCDEIDALRARLAEVEAERDGERARWTEIVAEVMDERDIARDHSLDRLAANIDLRARAEAAEARLAEVEAERDRALWFDHATTWRQAYDGQRARAEAAEARLANETENAIKAGDLYRQTIDTYSRLSRVQAARLAAVEALCDEAEIRWPAGRATRVPIRAVRAAARGEGDHA